MDDRPKTNDWEHRIQVLEQRIGMTGSRQPAGAPSLHPAWLLLLASTALALGVFGLGYPQHYYQLLFSGLLLLLLYHRGLLRFSRGPWKWPQAIVNFLVLCLLFKLLIGGGVSHPFDWIKLPAITKAPPSPGAQPWYSGVVPDYTVQWQAIPQLAGWSVDITKIQTFLLLAIFAGALFRFEPFTSIATLALLLVSLPSYLRYDWDWVVLFIIAAGVSLYLQTGAAGPSRRLDAGPAG